MPFFLRPALLLPFLATPAAAAVSDGQKFDDWQARCQAKPSGGEICMVAQPVPGGEGKGQIALILVGYTPDGKEAVMHVQTPLGTLLPRGLTLSVDQGQPSTYVYQFCVPSFCQATVLLTRELMEAMKKGSSASIAFQSLRGENVNARVSLKGFTAAVNALR